MAAAERFDEHEGDAASGAGTSPALWREVVDAMPQLVWVAGSDGEVVFYNQRAVDYDGIGQGDGRGSRRWEPVVHPDELERTWTAWSEAVTCGRDYECEHRLRMADGSYRWHVSRARPVSTGPDGWTTWFGTATDVHAQKEAELAVQGAERFTRQVLDSLFTFVGVLTPDGVLVEANRAPLEAADLVPDDVIGRPFWDCYWWSYDADVGRDLRRAVERAAAGEVVRYDVAVRVAGGAMCWIDFALVPLRDAGGEVTHLIPSGIDITDRVAAAAELQGAEDRLRTIFEVIDQAYCLCELVLDEDGTPVDYRFLEVNPSFEAMTGLVEATGRTAYDLIDGLEPHWLETYAEVALGGRPRRFQQGSEAMGRFFDVFVTPVPPHGRFAIVFVDISDRRASELAVAAAHLATERARHRAEVLATVVTELEAVAGVAERGRRLVRLVAQRLGRRATLELPGDGGIERFEAEHDVAEARAGVGRHAVVSSGGHGRIDRLRVPVPLEGAETGWLTVEQADPSAAEADDGGSTLLAEVATRAGLVLRGARVAEREHQVAVRLQQALLPGVPVVVDGIRIATRYVPATDALDVGGDWYETFRLPDGRLGVAVGDVVGHNLAAAVAMGQLRAGMLALAARATDPGDVLASVDAFARRHAVTDFATAVCAFLDPVSGAIEYSSAGHPPLLVRRPDGTTRWLDEVRSAPLASVAVDHRPVATDELPAGAVLVAFSDGLVERRRLEVTSGMAHLAEVVAAVGTDEPDAVCDAALAAMADLAPFEDDVAVLCVRRDP